MNKAINKSIAAILLAIICAFMPISAAEAATEKNQRLVSEETMYVDGYTVTVSVYEDETPVSVMPLAHGNSNRQPPSVQQIKLLGTRSLSERLF